MIFRKKIDKSCTYCVHVTQIDGDQILCIKKGVLPLTVKCRKFFYDPCKRIPVKPKALDFSKYNEEDYSL